VASTYLPPRWPLSRIHRRAGLYPRTESELRSAVSDAGLVGFERLLVEPFMVVKAEKR
jgi:hypothetical protein